MEGLVIVGAGGMGREVLEYSTQIAGMGLGPSVGGFLDDDPHALDGYDLPVGVVGSFSNEELLGGEVVIALGDPRLRQQLRTAVEHAGGTLHSIVHPAAWVASSASVGAGCIVAPGAFVGPNATLGQNVLVNATASVWPSPRSV